MAMMTYVEGYTPSAISAFDTSCGSKILYLVGKLEAGAEHDWCHDYIKMIGF